MPMQANKNLDATNFVHTDKFHIICLFYPTEIVYWRNYSAPILLTGC